jgi:hypothetical protein
MLLQSLPKEEASKLHFYVNKLDVTVDLQGAFQVLEFDRGIDSFLRVLSRTLEKTIKAGRFSFFTNATINPIKVVPA